MADITNSFVPSVTTAPIGVSPMTAQPVQPMQNAAPGQMQQIGAATEHLGLETQDIGERIQNQLDDAMAKNAESKFLQTAMTINNGDGTAANPGYLHLKGEAAINGLADAQTALAKAKQAGADSLSSDFQKAMYNRVAQQHLLSFGAQMVDHNFTQVSDYAAQASFDRAQTYATKAALSGSSYGQTDADGQPTGDYYTAHQAAISEAQNALLVSKGYPIGSDPSNAGVLKITTLMGQGALMQAIDAKQPFTTVQRMYDDMKGKGELDVQAIDSMGKQVASYVAADQGRTIVNQSLSDAQRASQGQPTSATGTPDYHLPIKGAGITAAPFDKDAGGVEVTIPANTPVQAPAAGVVTAAGPNEDGVPSLEIKHQNGSVTTLAGLNAFNVKVGDQVQSDENVATSGSSGNQKAPSVFWSLSDPKGNAVDPTQAGLPPVDTSKITDENVLHNALDSIRTQITDPKQQALATDEAESIVKINQRNDNAQKAQILQQATNQFYQFANDHHGTYSMNSIPQTLQAQIPPEALARFKDIVANPTPTKDDVNTVAGFYLHPETLTVANVQAARPNLSDSRYLSLLGDAQAMASAPPKLLAVTLDKEQLDATLVNNPGFKNLVDPKTGTEEFVESTKLRGNIRDQIDAEQTRTGRELDRAAKQKIIDTTLMNSVSVPGAVFGSNQLSAFELTPPQQQKAFVTVGAQKIPLASIPADQRAQAITALRGRGIPVTEQAIANLWVQAGKPGATK
jgi:murein DD-endopeptidase MepM/ murein hydrolase activator NlpD